METNSLEHSPTHFEHTRYSIWIQNKRVGCNIADSIQMHIQGEAVKKKLIEKGDVSSNAIDLIDWFAIGGASKLLTMYEKLWVSKFVSGFSATASQMHYRECGRNRPNKRKGTKRKGKSIEDEINNNTAP